MTFDANQCANYRISLGYEGGGKDEYEAYGHAQAPDIGIGEYSYSPPDLGCSDM